MPLVQTVVRPCDNSDRESTHAVASFRARDEPLAEIGKCANAEAGSKEGSADGEARQVPEGGDLTASDNFSWSETCPILPDSEDIIAEYEEPGSQQSRSARREPRGCGVC